MMNASKNNGSSLRPRVLFIIDNPYRELWGISAIAACLRRLGIPSMICSKINYALVWECYRPEAIVLPRVTNDMAGFVRKVSNHSWIFVIPNEHGSGFREKVLMNLSNVTFRDTDGGTAKLDTAPEVIDVAFLGGQNQYRWLSEAKLLEEGQMQVTGTLNSDHWCLKRWEGPSPRNGFRVGIATTNKSIFINARVRSVMGLLSTHRLGHWEESLWRVDFAAFEMAYMLLLTQVIEQMRSLQWNVSLRPHPHEYLPQWRVYQRMLKTGVELNRMLRVDEWLDTLSLVLASFSTVSIDAIARGIPSVSLHAMLPDRFFDALPPVRKPLLASYAWTPKSLDELYDLMEKARTGSLAPSPQPELSRKFMADNFNFPRGTFACEEIAQTIAGKIERRKGVIRPSATTTGTPTIKQGPLRFLCQIPGVKNALILLSYLKAFFRLYRRENLYFPFSYKQREGSRRYAARILRSIQTRPEGERRSP